MKSYDGYLYGKQILKMIDNMEMLFNFHMNKIAYFIDEHSESSFIYDCNKKQFIVNDSTGPGFDWQNKHFQNLIIDRFGYKIERFTTGFSYKRHILGLIVKY
ncbi:hypothetical protein M0Q50_09335 [bacterium]|jgi:hypothetical protein|nr:hypothetical protein [bacterium]